MSENNLNIQNVKKPFYQNISNLVQKGSAAVKEKISGLFNKKVLIQNNQKNTNNQNTPGDKVHIQLPNQHDNKHIFKIEEDEEAKENIYYLNDGNSDEDEEDEYEEEENEKEINKNKIADIIDNKDENKNILSLNSTTIPSNNDSLIDDNFDIENNYDNQTSIHRIYNKGEYIDISEILTTKFIKIKKSGIFSMIGFGKKNPERNYLVFFDEYFLYFMKDLEVSKTNKNLRKIGNKYNIKLIQNTIIDTEENRVHITLEFLKDLNSHDVIVKDLYFEIKQAERFVNLFNIYLLRLKISFSDENEQNEQNEEELVKDRTEEINLVLKNEDKEEIKNIEN